MTKEQFLSDLEAALARLPDEEREGALSYYAEMIDDRVEAGMTEEAAVRAMEPVAVIAARVLEDAGVQEEKSFKEDEERKKVIERGADALKELIVRAENKRIRLVRGDGDAVRLSYTIGENDIYRLHEDDGVLTLEHRIRPLSSFFNEKKEDSFSVESLLSGIGRFIADLGERVISGMASGAGRGDEGIEIALPADCRVRVEAITSNARVSAEGVCFAEPLKLGSSNAPVAMTNVSCDKEITVRTSNGRIALEGVNAGSAGLNTSNGPISLSGSTFIGGLTVTGSNGHIRLSEVTVEGALKARTSNGPVRLEGVRCPDVTVKSSNGAVSGTLVGRREDYTVSASTVNGSVRPATGGSGSKRLNVSTSNASVSIEFAEGEAAE